MSPLLAVAEAVRDERPDADFLFVGGRRGLEADLVRRAGLSFHATPLRSLRDPDSRLAFARQAGALPLAALDAFGRLLPFRPAVCVTSGGFSALPVVLAARALRVPVYLWVGDAVPGRASRTIARWAQRIGVAFADAAGELPQGRTVLAGNPVRRSLLGWQRSAARASLALPDDTAVVLVSGGSQGSERVNEAVWDALPRLLGRALVVHLAGAAHLERATSRKLSLPGDLRDRYRPFAFLGEGMGAALASADIVVGRAGSSSIAEPLAFGLPLVLIPFGAALAGHQDANARAVARLGAALVVDERSLSGERLAAEILGLLDDPRRLERMRTAARRAGRPRAAAEIAREVLALGRCA